MLTALLAALAGCGRAQQPPEPASSPQQGEASPAHVAQPPSAWAAAPPAPGGSPWASGVTVRLTKTFDGAKVVSFGLPVPAWAVRDPAAVRVGRRNGAPIAGARVKPLLYGYDRKLEVNGVRSLLVQFPASEMPDREMDVEVAWSAGADAAGSPASEKPPAADVAAPAAMEPYASVKVASPETVEVARRAIERAAAGGSYGLVEKDRAKKTLYTGWEPRVLATYPPGYLAATGILGEQKTRAEVAASPGQKGLSFLSEALGPFADSGMYGEAFPLNPAGVVDPVANVEGWLYDRCATYLLAYAHLGEVRHYRYALRACSFYASKIDDKGFFSLKLDWEGKPTDQKYSHLRGIYAYYALTGDEEALEAGRRMARMWAADEEFVSHYRRGTVRGKDKLWTERLLGVGMEGLVYGFLLTGDRQLPKAFDELLAAAYRHVTTASQEELSAINKVPFPPQNCFVRSAEQAGGGNATDPFCSGWMAEIVVDPLLRYQELTGDDRADEIFVRLTRSLRDTGTVYFQGDPRDDTFLSPSICYDGSLTEGVRLLAPLYGFGRRADGKRFRNGEWDDFEHCADATLLTAAAIRALERQGRFDAPGPAPFKTEGESFVAMHHEFAHCARFTFKYYGRTGRDPKNFTSARLAEGYEGGDEKKQAAWIDKNKIGFPIYESSPVRKLSWWFNGSLSQYRLLEDAGIAFPKLQPGAVQAPGCPASPR